MKSEERAKKFHTNYLGSASYWLEISFRRVEAIRSTTQLSMARSSDIISQGNHLEYYKMSAVFSCLSDQLLRKVLSVKQILL